LAVSGCTSRSGSPARIAAGHISHVVRRTHAVVIVHDGRVVAKRYAEGFGIDTPVHGWSATKSVNNALLGILVQQGKLIKAGASCAGGSLADARRSTPRHHAGSPAAHAPAHERRSLLEQHAMPRLDGDKGLSPSAIGSNAAMPAAPGCWGGQAGTTSPPIARWETWSAAPCT
jgi:hypothetical protein